MRLKPNVQTARLACLAAAAAVVAAGTAEARVTSDVVTAGKWTQGVGANLVNIPVHPSPTFLGKVTSVAGDVITVDGSLTAGALNSVLIDGVRDTAQYVIKLRHDRTGDGPQNQGAWWKIVSNTATTVTVAPNGIVATDSLVAVGDCVQIEKLPTLQEALGVGVAGRFDPDTDFDDTTLEGDTLYVLSGTSFNEALIYHDDTGTGIGTGWWDAFSGIFIGDGSTYTFCPDQAAYNFNNAGAAYDSTLSGGIQCFALAHLIFTGFNPVSTGFAAPAPIVDAGLVASGLTPDADFDDNLSDAVYTVVGTAFDKALIFHDGSLTFPPDPAQWWDAFGGTMENTFPLPAGFGFMVKNLSLPYIWFEPKP